MTAAATLNGAVGRGDAGAAETALDEYCLAKGAFAFALTDGTGVRVELIERWLSL